jgi:hypothetical protein
MRDEGLRRRMGEAGARRVRGTQSYRAMTEALERIYYETIERTAGEHHVRREKLWGAMA